MPLNLSRKPKIPRCTGGEYPFQSVRDCCRYHDFVASGLKTPTPDASRPNRFEAFLFVDSMIEDHDRFALLTHEIATTH